MSRCSGSAISASRSSASAFRPRLPLSATRALCSQRPMSSAQFSLSLSQSVNLLMSPRFPVLARSPCGPPDGLRIAASALGRVADMQVARRARCDETALVVAEGFAVEVVHAVGAGLAAVEPPAAADRAVTGWRLVDLAAVAVAFEDLL